MLGTRDFNQVFQNEVQKLYIDMIYANRLDELDDYIQRIDWKFNSKRILVLGYSQVSNSIIQEVCSDYGFRVENIELVTDKEKIRSFDCHKLKSKAYDLIVVGQLPHKMRNTDCTHSNVIRKIEENLAGYQNAFVARNNGRVRITKESLENILIRNMLTFTD